MMLAGRLATDSLGVLPCEESGFTREHEFNM